MKPLLVFIVAVLFSFTTVAKNHHEQKPYKAKTANECLHEKECVWHALRVLLSLSDVEKKALKDKNSQGIFISRRNEDVKLSIVGNYNDQLVNELRRQASVIQPYFPYQIDLGSPYNHLIIFSENLDYDISTKYRKAFINMFGSDYVYKNYKKVDLSKNKKCINLRLEDPETKEITKGLISIIKINDAETDFCIKQAIFASTGHNYFLDDFEFSFLDRKNLDLTVVDLFLIYFLYSDIGKRINSNFNIDGVKSTFDISYDRALKNFLIKYNDINFDE